MHNPIYSTLNFIILVFTTCIDDSILDLEATQACQRQIHLLRVCLGIPKKSFSNSQLSGSSYQYYQATNCPYLSPFLIKFNYLYLINLKLLDL